MKKKFTIIELVMVLAIIAILASLLFPALRRARMSAKKAVCMNNLNQQYTGYLTFATDNKGRAPFHRSSDNYEKSNWINSRGKLYNWGTLYVQGYLSGDQILADPTYQGNESKMVVTGSEYNDVNDLLFTVSSANERKKYKNTHAKLRTHYSVRPLIERSKEAYDLEDYQGSLITAYVNKAMISCGLIGMYTPDDGGPCHGMDGINTIFFDGSVKFLKGEYVNLMLSTKASSDYWDDNDNDGHPDDGFWYDLDSNNE